MTEFLGKIQQDQTLLFVSLIVMFALGAVTLAIWQTAAEWIGGIRADMRERREARQDLRAQEDVERIRHAWLEENSDEWDLTNATYHAAGLRTVSERWRDRLDRTIEMTKPRSPEWVANDAYQPFYEEAHQVRLWPEWLPEERAIVGRHRQEGNPELEARPVSPAPGYTERQLRALVTKTGAYELVAA